MKRGTENHGQKEYEIQSGNIYGYDLLTNGFRV